MTRSRKRKILRSQAPRLQTAAPRAIARGAPLISTAVLAAITVIGMLQTGYQMGLVGGRIPLSAPAFALAFSAVIYLIADLDRPRGGLVQVSQLPMAELRQSMTEPAP